MAKTKKTAKKKTAKKKTAKKSRSTTKKKKNQARGGRRGLAGVYDKKSTVESTGSVTLTFSPGDVEITAQRRKRLVSDIRTIVREYRAKSLDKQDGRDCLTDYLGTSGHSFMDLVRFKGISNTSQIADIIIDARLLSGLATQKGHVVEDIAGVALPLSDSQQWHRLDSRRTLKEKIKETLGFNILKQLDLYGVHKYEGGKMLRLVGLKLNAVSSNGNLAQYESNSLSNVAAMGRLAKSVGADRVEIVLGVAYDNGDTQPKSVLKKLAEELEPRGWKRLDVAAGYPCIASPDGTLQFRVLVGPRLWGYLAKPRDESGELDIMAMLTEAQNREPVKGQGIIRNAKKSLMDSMDSVFRSNRNRFLADRRYTYLKEESASRQRLSFWCESMTGSWKLS